VSGEPRGGARESEQNVDWRTEVTQRTLLSERQPTRQLAARVCSVDLRCLLHTHCHRWPTSACHFSRNTVCSLDLRHLLLLFFFRPWYFIPRVWDIKQSVWCLERLQWGLVNCESVRQADCVETLDCGGDPLVQECRFTRVGSAHRCSPANLGDKLVCLVCQDAKCLHSYRVEHVAGCDIAVLLLLLLLLLLCITVVGKCFRCPGVVWSACLSVCLLQLWFLQNQLNWYRMLTCAAQELCIWFG